MESIRPNNESNGWKRTEPGIHQRAAWLYEQLDQLRVLRRKAKQAMLDESRKHRAVGLLKTIPELGSIRAAFIVATVDTPHRFRTKRQFWSYVGLAVVTHMSSEYEMKAGQVVRRRKPIATRGLNRNCNRRLKEVFIAAATGGSRHKPYGPFLERLKENGIRAEMARLTLARKIAAVALMVWKKGVEFDPKKLNCTTSRFERFSGSTMNSTSRRRCARNGVGSRVRISRRNGPRPRAEVPM